MPKGTSVGNQASVPVKGGDRASKAMCRVPGRHSRRAGVRSGFAFPWGPMVKRMVMGVPECPWGVPVCLGRDRGSGLFQVVARNCSNERCVCVASNHAR